jgi:hypothetical protein
MPKRDRGRAKDPLVPVSAKRLQAVLGESGTSVARLARIMKIPQPTLQYVVSGKTRRCRASMLTTLARRFDVQERWLRGDKDAGPFRDRLDADAEAHGTIFREGERRVGLPLLLELRAARLVERCLDRWEQDLASGVAPPPDRYSLLGEVRIEMREERRALWLGAYLEYVLMSAHVFRQRIYEFPTEPTLEDTDLYRWLTSKDDAFATAWLTALEHLLSPWLEGERRLDYEACYDFLEASRRTNGRMFERARRAGILEALWPKKPRIPDDVKQGFLAFSTSNKSRSASTGR